MDQFGENLNRYYNDPNPSKQPSIFAAKSLIEYYAKNRKLCMYLDMHAHTSKRGCFIYGNVLDSVNDQIQNQLFCKLVSLNSPHFDYEACLFDREHMQRTDPSEMQKGEEMIMIISYSLPFSILCNRLFVFSFFSYFFYIINVYLLSSLYLYPFDVPLISYLLAQPLYPSISS